MYDEWRVRSLVRMDLVDGGGRLFEDVAVEDGPVGLAVAGGCGIFTLVRT
jgi:hypothetical protein